MAAQALAQRSRTAVARAAPAWLSGAKAASLASKLDERREAEAEAAVQAAVALEEARAAAAPRRKAVQKSFALHLGADLHVPTADARDTHTLDEAQPAAPASDPFAGLPLRAWAERLGERIMPAYELVKEEQRRAKAAAKTAPPQELSLPQIPHLLPFTRWAASNASIRDTFVAEDAKTRKRARLSWYHPDDTMVPRDWFRGGLLEDIKYYAPFARRKEAPAS